MKKYVIILLLLFVAGFADAQQQSTKRFIYGKLVRKDPANAKNLVPASNVKVMLALPAVTIDKTICGAKKPSSLVGMFITDSKGEYNFWVSPAAYVLIICDTEKNAMYKTSISIPKSGNKSMTIATQVL